MTESLYPHQSPLFWAAIGLLIVVMDFIAARMLIPKPLPPSASWCSTYNMVSTGFYYPLFFSVAFVGVLVFSVSIMWGLGLLDEISLVTRPYCKRRVL